MEKKVLLHICCGVCAGDAIQRLRRERFLPVGYFYNPNIQPFTEFLRRKESVKKVADFLKIKLIKSRYEPLKWKKRCDRFKNEKEGGRRCGFCFRLRLAETAKKAKIEGFPYFTTTLTISPHKNSQKIFEIGSALKESEFLKIDFKKKDGFKKTLGQAKALNLYRQNYCGCKTTGYTD